MLRATAPFILLVTIAVVLGASSAPARAASASASAWSTGGAAWTRPVPGEVTRAFAYGHDPFAAGQHRGVDLAAPRGSAVRAPCTGRVVAAGRVGSSGRVVTLACGPWHVTVLPLARVEVGHAELVTAGAEVGTSGTSAAHAGIHLGIRRASDRFGYVDPLRFLTRARPPSPLAPRAPRGAGRRRPAPVPVPVARPLVPRAVPAARPLVPHAAPVGRPLPSEHPHGALPPIPARSSPPDGAFAPWSAWVGAVLGLAGASGGVVRARRRSRRAPAAEAAAAAGVVATVTTDTGVG